MPERWGLTKETTADLGEELCNHWERFRGCFRTQTRDTSKHALAYIQGQLTMDAGRHIAGIARTIEEGSDGQALQHFISNSCWSERKVYEQIQAELKGRTELQKGGYLIVDEYADEKSGVKSAGSGRQYNGRMGKTDECQVGVVLGYANWQLPVTIWAMLDAELYLPASWLSEEAAEARKRVGIPEERTTYQTKPELAAEMILQAKKNEIPFEVLLCDDLYGRSHEFRSKLEKAEIVYMADIPCDTRVYLTKPEVGIPPNKPHKKGTKNKKKKLTHDVQSHRVDRIANDPDTVWHTLLIRNNERGVLRDRFAARRVWLWHPDQSDGEPRDRWLVLRIERNGDRSYALCNAPNDAPLATLAQWKCGRYFVERLIEDGKDDLGMDEFMAQKYRAWQHHTALTACALWFIAAIKLKWGNAHPHDPELLQQLQLQVLPALSTANIILLLKAILPVHQLTLEQAQAQVAKHLANRSRSTASRLRRSPKPDT